MRSSTERRYATQADRELGKYDDVHIGRSDMIQSEGATGRAWLKFNPGKEILWLDDIDGMPRWVTRNQLNVWLYVKGHYGESVPMHVIASKLGLAVSTISRAMVKLASFGLFAYVSVRGRHGGTFIIKRSGLSDGLERFRQVAKATIRRWAKASADRFSRLQSNVATSHPMRERVSTTSSNSMVATLERWTPEELRDAGII